MTARTQLQKDARKVDLGLRDLISHIEDIADRNPSLKQELLEMAAALHVERCTVRNLMHSDDRQRSE